MRKLAACVLLVSAPLVAGCFDIEQSLTLERNLSGKAGFTMKVDLEAMVGFAAQMKRSMEGKEGAPTEAELAEARKDMLANSKTSGPGDFEKEKKELEATLPKGVTLLDGSVKQDGLKMTVNLAFGFDHVSKLSAIKLPKTAGADPSEPGNPVDTPFDGLTVTEEGTTILVTSKTQNPMADTKDLVPPGGDPAMANQIAGLFKGLRVAFKVTSPFAIVEQNAHRKEANTLIWEFDMNSLLKLTPAQLEQGIRVRYRK
jgi:hypothetical protein